METVGPYARDRWEWCLNVVGVFVIHGVKDYATKRAAHSAARRVAKQLNLTIEE